jgi:hypothetical protein
MKHKPEPRPTPEIYEIFLKNGKWGHSDQDFVDAYNWMNIEFEVNGKIGLKNCIGEQLLNPIFEEFEITARYPHVIGELVSARYNGKWGVVKLDGGDGVWLIEPEYDYIDCPSCSTKFRKNGKLGVMNVFTKEWILPLFCDYIHADQNTTFLYSGITCYEVNDKLGLALYNGDYTDAIFDEVDKDNESYYYKARIGELWGYVAKDGQLVQERQNAHFRTCSAEYNNFRIEEYQKNKIVF